MRPRHGGQMRLDTIVQGLRRTGWAVTTAGIYPANLFPAEEQGKDDIVLDEEVAAALRDDMLFFDLQVARRAANDPAVVTRLRQLLWRISPDMIHLEQPWGWLPLREALQSSVRPKLVYSSQNIEWRFRPELFRLGLKRPGADALVEATRLLEIEVARAADLVVAISDLEAAEIEQIVGHPVLYAPPVSDLADLPSMPVASRFSVAAAEAGVTACAALMGSAYWPNVEGFFDLFPHGLGFLPLGEQIWAAGAIGSALEADVRFQDFLSVNASRMRTFGYLPQEERAAFFGAAACVLVPVRMGAGAKLKTADAIASGRPVIITPHALEGYGPIVREAIGRGVYVADTPAEFRALVRQALRGDAVGCAPEISTSRTEHY
jgi:hypothetical protein